MQSDQKIGLCLLIALCGFAAALGFGRRDRTTRGDRVATELASAADLFPVKSITPERSPRLETVELSPTGEVVLEPVSPQVPAYTPPPFNPPLPVSRAVRESPVSQPLPAQHKFLPFDRVPSLSHRGSEDAGQNSTRDYVVQPGDTLSGIASRELGDVGLYYKLFEANRDRLAHPDALRVGQTLKVPRTTTIIASESPESGLQ